MSSEYFALVPKGRWPSYRALNDAFERQGFPVQIFRDPKKLSADPVCELPDSPGLRMLVEDMAVDLETRIDGPYDDPGAIEAANIDLKELGSSHRAKQGDWVVNVTLHDETLEWRAGCYLIATLIREFAAYGYEIDEGEHGEATFADWLVYGADRDFEYEDTEGEADGGNDERPASARAFDFTRKWLNVARWVAIPAIILLWGAKTWHQAEAAGLDPWTALTEPFG